MKKREIDIFGVLVGIVVGCILGFFLSTRINLNIPGNEKDEEVLAQAGNIYLLQIEKTAAPANAEDTLKKIKAKDMFAVAVLEGNSYYIYGGIANTESELLIIQDDFSSKGFDSIIKKVYIKDKPNVVLGEEKKFEFYTECIDNLIKSLKGEDLDIGENSKSNPVDVELFSNMLALDSISNDKLLSELRLVVYELIIEKLSQ